VRKQRLTSPLKLTKTKQKHFLKSSFCFVSIYVKPLLTCMPKTVAYFIATISTIYNMSGRVLSDIQTRVCISDTTRTRMLQHRLSMQKGFWKVWFLFHLISLWGSGIRCRYCIAKRSIKSVISTKSRLRHLWHQTLGQMKTIIFYGTINEWHTIPKCRSERLVALFLLCVINIINICGCSIYVHIELYIFVYHFSFIFTSFCNIVHRLYICIM
jgi:hypothetical protein